MDNIQIINGPNLNLLAKRKEHWYGNLSFEDFYEKLQQHFSTLTLHHFQSNVEGEIINKLHQIGFDKVGIILNPGGYAHTSVAIRDAISSIAASVIEVHLSPIHTRENFRHKSITSSPCIGCINGFGLESYTLAVQYFLNRKKGIKYS